MNKTWALTLSAEYMPVCFSQTALCAALTPMKNVLRAEIGARCESTTTNKHKIFLCLVNKK